MAVAVVLILFSLFAPLLIPAVASTGLSTELKTVLSGLLVFGIPQLLMVLAIASVGKSGFNYIKGRAFGLLKGLAPRRSVGRARYRIGLVLFFIPVVLAFLGPYVEAYLPKNEELRLAVAICGDVMFVSSLFVLGGEFWDKLRALFIHDATAVIPEK